MLILQHERMRI